MDTLFDQLLPPAPRPYSAYAPIKRPRAVRWEERPREAAAEIERVAGQLARVAEMVSWGRVQDDAWDELSRFIYQLRTAGAVREHAEIVAGERGLDSVAFAHYALRRWYCFWGARVAELLFIRHAGVRPGPPRDRQVDFTIDGVPFDLKTTEVPRIFLDSMNDLASNPGKLASWLYEHQSLEGRFHSANRLFLLLCDPDDPGAAWRLRGDVPALRTAIDRFMARRRFVELVLPDRYGIERTVLTAVVPVRPVRPGRQLRML